MQRICTFVLLFGSSLSFASLVTDAMDETPRRPGASRRRYLAALVDSGDEASDEEAPVGVKAFGWGRCDDESDDEQYDVVSESGSDASDESDSPEKLCLRSVRHVVSFMASEKYGEDSEVCGPEAAPGSPPRQRDDQSEVGSVGASPIRIHRGEDALAGALEVLRLGSPGKRAYSKQAESSVEAIMVSSPAKRLRSKQASPLVPRRSDKYCSNPSCGFNRFNPGQPARKVPHEL